MSSGSKDETIVVIGPHEHALADAIWDFDKAPGLHGVSAHDRRCPGLISPAAR
ncbi:MAG TPA: hypothetical protein VGV39_05980 [Mesorhizobium sp.]|jgi:hypothetical protein|uniref:hypothetical protein n=1 Tax=Mesorhizobium sp. TaxID=1871066 RepID=UPI002DDD77EE|nr:hypothetical protein [Mesorhizobium sp.]HEV2502602.1 hypothetical protein [Mesorhizobium sp.]